MKYGLFAAMVVCSLVLQAQSPQPEVFAPGGHAIGGYDAVAFFKTSKAVKGSDSLSYRFNRAIWLFSSRENLDSFANNPQRYAPQYGGYCAYGLSEGHKAPTEISTWSIQDDKLYFNYNLNVKKLWDKSRPELISKADSNWMKIKDN